MKGRTRVALLLLVLAAVAGLLAYGLPRLGEDTAKAEHTPPNLKPLLVRRPWSRAAGPVAEEPGSSASCPTSLCPAWTERSQPYSRGDPAARSRRWSTSAGRGASRPRRMPVLRQLHQRAGTRLRIVGVDTEDDPRDGLSFRDRPGAALVGAARRRRARLALSRRRGSQDRVRRHRRRCRPRAARDLPHLRRAAGRRAALPRGLPVTELPGWLHPLANAMPVSGSYFSHFLPARRGQPRQRRAGAVR